MSKQSKLTKQEVVDKLLEMGYVEWNGLITPKGKGLDEVVMRQSNGDICWAKIKNEFEQRLGKEFHILDNYLIQDLSPETQQTYLEIAQELIGGEAMEKLTKEQVCDALLKVPELRVEDNTFFISEKENDEITYIAIPDGNIEYLGTHRLGLTFFTYGALYVEDLTAEQQQEFIQAVYDKYDYKEQDEAPEIAYVHNDIEATTNALSKASLTYEEATRAFSPTPTEDQEEFVDGKQRLKFRTRMINRLATDIEQLEVDVFGNLVERHGDISRIIIDSTGSIKDIKLDTRMTKFKPSKQDYIEAEQEIREHFMFDTEPKFDFEQEFDKFVDKYEWFKVVYNGIKYVTSTTTDSYTGFEICRSGAIRNISTGNYSSISNEQDLAKLVAHLNKVDELEKEKESFLKSFDI